MKEMEHFCMSGLPLRRTSWVFAGAVTNTAVTLAERAMPEGSLMQGHHLPRRVRKMHHDLCVSP